MEQGLGAREPQGVGEERGPYGGLELRPEESEEVEHSNVRILPGRAFPVGEQPRQRC